MTELFMHTPKAVKRGHPADRVFVVITVEGRNRIAWKCELRDGKLWHPAFKTLLPLTEAGIKKATVSKGCNGAEPSAVFYLDSFYRRIALDDLRK